MTRVLLMSMPDIYQSWHEGHIIGPSLSLASLAGNCPNHKVYGADLVLKRKDVKAGIDEAIKLTNPERVGLSAMTFQYPTAIKVAQYIKENYPGIPVILGGYHATALRREIVGETDAFDYIFEGPSKLTFREFLDGKRLGDISALSFRRDGRWVHNERNDKHNSGNVFPPKRDSRIWKGYHFHSRTFDTAESSQGCNNECPFCSIRLMHPEGYSSFPYENVIADLETAKARGTSSIFFTDDNPVMYPELFKEFLHAIIRRGLNGIRYSGTVSTASMTDSELTDLMKKAGWDFVFLGVENISQKNIRALRKPTSERIARKAIKNLYNSGITILAGIIVGNPDDTEESIRENLQWFHDQPVDTVMPQYLTPYPRTRMRQQLLEEGLVVNPGGIENNGYGSWSTYNGEFVHCMTRNGLMPEDIERIVYEESRELERVRFKRLISGRLNFLYNNPKHLLHWVLSETLPVIKRTLQQKGLSSSERAKLERQRKIAMNQFNI